MPLLIFLGEPRHTRRTPEAREKRSQKAIARGWVPSRWKMKMDRGVAYVRDVRGGGAHYNNISNSAQQNAADNTRGRGAEQDNRKWVSGEHAQDWNQSSWDARDLSHAGDWNQDSWDQLNKNKHP